MKKIIVLLCSPIIFLSNSAFSYSGYYAPYEGTKCITQGWSGGYSHGITDGEQFSVGTKLAYALDISGTFDVLAVKDGEIVSSGWHNGFGNYIVVQHNDGLYSQYAHLKTISISTGIVKKGMVLGKSGNTGSYSGGTHLHLQMTTTKNLITSLAGTERVDFQGFTINEVDKLNSLACSSVQRKTSLNTVYQGNSSNTTESKASYFDGAGSIIQTATNCWGCNKDEARMQAHNIPSTVVFQWTAESNCSYLKIKASDNSGFKVTVKNKLWNDHLVKAAYKATLPITVSNKGYWNTTAITSQESLSSTKRIIAECTNSPIAFNKTNIEKDLVDFSNGYYWAGNGSIISKDGSGTGTGVTEDWAVAFNSNKAFTIFQWQSSNRCSSLLLEDSGNSSVSVNQVDMKGWADTTWKGNHLCNGSLPCTLNAPVDSYQIVKIKTNASSVPSGTIHASCK